MKINLATKIGYKTVDLDGNSKNDSNNHQKTIDDLNKQIESLKKKNENLIKNMKKNKGGK